LPAALLVCRFLPGDRRTGGPDREGRLCPAVQDPEEAQTLFGGEMGICMLTDTFSKALNTIDDRYLLEAMGEGTARRKRPRMALRLCAAAVTALLLVGTALAVSPALR